ncbi:proteasome assembly chaperone 1 [Scleropages formosus]|nr:proteasome assembly chaperone 1 [Scleropages formosus]
MATFFGEVLSVYSRAVEEDEDDLEDENEEDKRIRSEIEQKRSVHVEWCPEVQNSLDVTSEKTLPFSQFLIAVGPNAAGFLSTYVLSSGKWDSIGLVSLWNERSESQQYGVHLQQEAGCVFYKQKECSSVLICQCTLYIAEDQLFPWAEKVFACIQRRGLTVTVLSDAPLSEFKSPNSLYSTTPFLRALRTSAYKTQVSCQLLEQPNIATGLAAAVLSYCQVQKIPAVLYQCYSDVIVPNSITMETYKPALSSLSEIIKLDSCPNADVLKRLLKASEIQSNMYT